MDKMLLMKRSANAIKRILHLFYSILLKGFFRVSGLQFIWHKSYKARKWLYHFSGAKLIWQRFKPPKDSGKLPSGPVWLLGIYLALFGVGSQRYENRVDIIENRSNAIFAQLSTNRSKAISRIAEVQNMLCPAKPYLEKPWTVLSSLFSEEKYPEVVNLLKTVVEDYKESLSKVNLSMADLSKVNLSLADLSKADLSKADLSKARFSETNLFGAHLYETNFFGAIFTRADLYGADLHGADLSWANLYNANLSAADLYGANLYGANLTEANLSGANFSGDRIYSEFEERFKCDLCDAQSLYKAQFDPEMLTYIKANCPDLLKFPDYLKNAMESSKAKELRD